MEKNWLFKQNGVLIPLEIQGNKPFRLVVENVAVSADTHLEIALVLLQAHTYALHTWEVNNVKLYVPGEGGSGSGDGGNMIEPTPNE